MVDNLITYEGWDEMDTGVFQFYQVHFIADFGPFRVNEEFEFLVVDFHKGLMEGVLEGQEKSCKLKLAVGN